ncbi:hypothetical protein DSL72_005889 [Monilinia vaccinii-corymbosi]|uniref:Peptidase A1 domain-containing protein n=1 Tax=Monilinia vaccinii-corymbosi TaxID=61207 RepID=A0A8A3PGY8_9HELO|nr:hypothetical protein DSL72_005889 [Monilinia vaccinii-corymbosi]
MVFLVVKCALAQLLVLLLVLGQFVVGVVAVKALSVAPSSHWFGNDGSWSAVSVRLGFPQQWVNLFPNTLSEEIWGVGPCGCKDDGSPCATSRGSLFNSSRSSTWRSLYYLDHTASWSLDTVNSLHPPPSGEFGLDHLAFGADGPTIDKATIATINDTEHWVGSFGLGDGSGNFTYVTPKPMFSQLQDRGEILGAGYGYTAGAKYQQKGEPLSLTLGGYDENRFIPHNVTFNLVGSAQPIPRLFIESISVLSTNGSNTPIELLSSEDGMKNTLIDSSTPYLWLPEEVCDRFADALGLTYNETLNLYTFDENPNQHDNLSDPTTSTTFTFRLKDEPTVLESVNITLPYAAFDLQLTYPYIPNTEYGSDEASKFYFPLARAANASQYTIGRAFLQEAYIITNYEKSIFSIHQAVHVSDTIYNTSIVAFPRGTQDSHLSEDKTICIAIGISIFGTGITLASLCCYLIKYYKPRKHPLATTNSISDSETGIRLQHDSPSFAPGTLEAPMSDNHPFEINSERTQPAEVDTEVPHQRLELAAAIPGELPSGIPVQFPAELEGSSPYGGFTFGTSSVYQSGLNVSPISVSLSGSLPPMAALAISSTEPSCEQSPSPAAPTRASVLSDDVSPMSQARMNCRMSPPPTYALAHPNSSIFGGAMSSSLRSTTPFDQPTRVQTSQPSNYVFAGRIPSGIQASTSFDQTIQNRNAQVNEWRRRDQERQAHEEELHRQALALEEETREEKFLAARRARRQLLEKMEIEETDAFKYRTEDVGDLRDPFGALVRRNKILETGHGLTRAQGFARTKDEHALGVAPGADPGRSFFDERDGDLYS